MRTPQVTPDWNTGIYIGNGVITKKTMRRTVDVYTDKDLLGCITSPHTTPDEKRAALKERNKRANMKGSK